MKRFLRMAASAAFVLLLSACARHKIIPDDTLAQIFHDAFLTNAYIGSEGVKTDSLRIYEPIFARYGYTTDTTHRRLRIDFLTFNARPERPSVTVTDLKVEYIPPTRTAVEKLYEQQLDIRIFADDFLRAAAIPKDSL